MTTRSVIFLLLLPFLLIGLQLFTGPSWLPSDSRLEHIFLSDFIYSLFALFIIASATERVVCRSTNPRLAFHLGVCVFVFMLLFCQTHIIKIRIASHRCFYAVGDPLRLLFSLGLLVYLYWKVRRVIGASESMREESTTVVQQCAPPNDGPATSVDNSNAPGGPPSVR